MKLSEPVRQRVPIDWSEPKSPRVPRTPERATVLERTTWLEREPQGSRVPAKQERTIPIESSKITEPSQSQ